MQRINWEMSRDKWVPIVALLEKPGRVDWDKIYDLMIEDCGHCKENDFDCNPCSLFKPGLCRVKFEKTNPGYFYLRDMAEGLKPRNKRRALSIARRIYKAILKDEPKLTKL